jgi:hypothetical protein
MRYKLFLIVFLIPVLLASTGMAAEKRYRVEILVLTHLQHEAIPAEVDSLRDFSESLDFLKAEDDEESGEDEKDTANPDAKTASGLEAGESEQDPGSDLLPDTELEEEPWADVEAVETMSEVMQQTWRRLRLSAPFRPQQYLSWEQGRDEPFPLLRIHDEEVILTNDPYADLRETDAVDEETNKTVVFSDQGNLLPGDALEEPELPGPTLFYRIDGTVMLRRTRFLHLDLDLVLRAAVFDDPAEALPPVLSQGSRPGELEEAPEPTSFLIHKLEQSRQVKSNRMEYFDGAVLSALAWISSVAVEDEADDE